MPGQTVGAVYMTITGGAADDTLVRALVPADVAAEVQLHEMASKGDTMVMRETHGIVVPGHGEVKIAPSGLHIMVIGLKAPLAAGDEVPVTLEFAKGGTRTVAAEVREG